LRWLVTGRFNLQIAKYLPAIHEVALVGGGENEPELEIFKFSDAINLEFFGIELIPGDNFTFLDLNENSDFEKEFDLVICSQVLEHVWNHSVVFDNLAKLVKPGGLLWISCPASNYAHGSPEYYSAGFTADYLVKNMHIRNFDPVASESLGSRRYYFLTHALQIWGSERGHAFPLLFGISRFYPREFFGRFFAMALSSKVKNEMRFATESYALLRKRQ